MSNNQSWSLLQSIFRQKSDPPQTDTENSYQPPESETANPIEQLHDLRKQYGQQQLTAKQTLNAQEVEKRQIQREIQALHAKLAQLSRDSVRLQDEISQMDDSYHRQEYKLLQISLATSYETLCNATEFWANLLELQAQHRIMLKKDSELEEVLADFLALDQQLMEIVSNLPKSYQQSLEERHRELDVRVRPYRELKHSMQILQYENAIQLMVIVIPVMNTRQVSWIIPFPANIIINPEDKTKPLFQVGNVLLDSLMDLSLNTEWHFEDIQVRNWATFTTLVATVEYDGEQDLKSVTESILKKAVSESPLFTKLTINVNIESMDQTTWELGLIDLTNSDVGTEQAETDKSFETVNSVDSPPSEPVIPVEVATQGWYSDADIQSWERRVDNSNSNWNQQARRLRTVLIRLIAKGKFGTEAVPLETLWLNLPAPHAELMKAGLDKLLAAEVLKTEITKNGTDGQKAAVALNPDLISEMQSLINRDISDFWQPLLVDTPSQTEQAG